MDISVIIPTYNRAKYIGLTIKSFIKQNYPKNDFEIIISDNNSTDNTKTIIQGIIDNNKDFNIRYLFEERQGVHFARNTAAKASNGDVLYFTDDDMIADRNLLKSIMDIYKNNRKVAVCTGRVLPRWKCKPPKWVRRCMNNAYLSLNDQGDKIVITDYDWCTFSCHEAILRNVFFQTNGFHIENTKGNWLGDGETGLNKEIEKKGYYFAYTGKAITRHIIPKARMTQDYLNKRMYNGGISEAYYEFKRGNLDVRRKVLIKRYFDTCLSETKNFIKGHGSMRFIIGWRFFYKAKRDFLFKYNTDPWYQKMVDIDNWLD